MKSIYKLSKWVHKWTSIIISLFLIWMSISGIILNHPELITSISIPGWMLPDDYDLNNWNRSSLIQAEFSNRNPYYAYLVGNEGIVATNDGGYTFRNLNINGYPQSAFSKRTKSVALFESEAGDFLFTGTFSGLYQFDFINNSWSKQNLPTEYEKVIKLLKYQDSLIVVTDSEMFIASILDSPIRFSKIELNRVDNNPKMTMIEFFFQLHSGELWGLPGKLVFDVAGLILLFLSISGLYIWLSPKYRHLKESLHLKRSINHTGWFFRNHLKLGIWSFVVLLIFAITGLFMRPPLIAALLGKDIALNYIPMAKPENYWQHRIRNATYDETTNRVIIDTKDGYWVSENGLYGNYINELPPVPIFAMGATVFDHDDRGNLLIGSFAGLYKVSSSGLMAENVIDSEEPIVSSVRPGANLITGYVKDPNGYEYVTTHFGGILNVDYPNLKIDKFQMPEFLIDNYSMSLWNFLFELHNGRIFQSIIGEYYILLIPLGSLIFILVIITGVFDWLYLKFKH